MKSAGNLFEIKKRKANAKQRAAGSTPSVSASHERGLG